MLFVFLETKMNKDVKKKKKRDIKITTQLIRPKPFLPKMYRVIVNPFLSLLS